MLYKFKSKVTGDVIMLQPNGAQLLEIIGKRQTCEPATQGILLPGQMTQALADLQAAIDQEDAERRDAIAHASKENLPPPRLAAIALRQRALPLMEMMRACQKADQPIVWGV